MYTPNKFLVTVDGTDCRICEPIPFEKRWFSHKFKGPGLRYELSVAIATGDIVSYNGPFPCGEFPDITIFRLGIRKELGPGETIIVDCGYKGDVRVVTPDDPYVDGVIKKAMSKARARHETINSRLKKWGALKDRYRHPLNKHHVIFRAIVVIEQIRIENGHPPFQVKDYSDNLLKKV